MPADTLVFHPRTARQITEYLSRPAHALLISGANGSGKSSLAHYLAGQLLDDASLGGPYVRIVRPIDAKAIGIEAIRELEKFLSLQVPTRSQSIKRIIIIEDAHKLTDEASNALLKTLEEPPRDTVILLTATSDDSVLPTIRSRVQLLQVQPPDSTELQKHFETLGYDSTNIGQALLVSGQLPGLASALLAGDSDHPLVPATTQARELLGASLYDRLARVDSLSKQRELLQDTVYVLGQMSHTALLRSSSPAAGVRWQRVLRASHEASDQIAGNANLKLVATTLMLNL